ncbi:hypothetical protein GV828_10970 [Flavobacterium sp. NST-5]|uniref:DinB-like domain-containing protein n=1 Tax=Flavobacterium ichthyis TaxID=2698827 RepID=A0ABW9ZA13_9FLAO|nr:DinB family protein [Flavobacterium ichthyis]NBL65721.1 hypothetical protein [Flavobacterium ichthyis]
MEPENIILKQQLHETFDQLIITINKVDEDHLNKKISANEWSVGQIVEHIIMAVSGFEALFSKENSASERPMNKKATLIREVFLNFETKYVAPEMVVPNQSNHQKNKLIFDLKNLRQKLLELVENIDLTLIPQHFEITGFGKFSRFEWFTFAVFHTQRHHFQIIETLKIVTSVKD